MKKTLFMIASLLFLSIATHLQAQSCISGIVYEDLNSNGILDAAETGLGNLDVYAISSVGAVNQVMTNTEGFYEFCDLADDIYQLYLLLEGTGLSALPASRSVEFVDGENNTGNHFGLAAEPELGEISGKAYMHFYNQGVQDDTEPALLNYTLELTAPDGSVRSALTDKYGEFRFQHLSPGTYMLSISAPPAATAWILSSYSLPITLGASVEAVFELQAELGFTGVSDRVCYDLDGDGMIDPDTEPGFSGKMVELLDETGEVMATTYSDGNGLYGFLGIASGTYTVRSPFDDEELAPSTPTAYTVNPVAGQVLSSGPFYFTPLKSRFKCGMAIHSFNTEESNNKLAVWDTRDRTAAPSGSAWSIMPMETWAESDVGIVRGIAIGHDYSVYVSSIGGTSHPIGSGGIFKIDPVILGATPFVTTVPTGPTLGSATLVNTGRGLGNLCFNNQLNTLLYVTNLEDGSINVVRASDGVVLQTYVPFSASERPFGIAYNLAQNRLYFSVEGEIGTPRPLSTIYSLTLDATGMIVTTAPVLIELTTPVLNPHPTNSSLAINTPQPIPDIAFNDDYTELLYAERHTHRARVMHSTFTGTSWNAAVHISYGTNTTDATGGVDFAYESILIPATEPENCDNYLVATADALEFGSAYTYGFGFTSPGALVSDVFIDNDNAAGVSGTKGRSYDVEVFDCDCALEPPPPCADSHGLEIIPNSPVEPIGVGDCCHSLDFINTGNADVYGIQVRLLDGVEFQQTPNPPILASGLIRPNYTDSSMTIVPAAFGPMPTNIAALTDFCLENVLSIPQYMVVEYLDEAYEVFCSDTLTFDCPPQAECLQYVQDSLVCDSAGYKLTIDVQVPAGNQFPIGYIKFNLTQALPAGAYVEPIGANAAPALDGHLFGSPLVAGDVVSLMYIVHTAVDLNPDSLCYIITAHDDEEERLCCYAYETCTPFPLCNPCPYVGAAIRPTSEEQSEYCCYELLITDTFSVDPSAFTSVEATICTPGVTYSGLNTLPALVDGWTPVLDDPVATTSISWTHNSGNIPSNIVDYNLFDFCVDGSTTTDSIEIKVSWLNADSIVCSDTLSVYCPQCLTVLDDQLSCIQDASGAITYLYHFSFVNHSAFNVNAIRLLDADSHPGLVGNPGVYMLGTTLAPGDTYTGSIPVTLNGNAGDEVCFDIVLRQIIGDDINISCCYVTHCIELPECENFFECPDQSMIEDLACEDVFDPVCGCDGITYANICLAQINGVFNWTSGVCDGFDPITSIDLSVDIEEDYAELDWQPAMDYDFYVIMVRWGASDEYQNLAIKAHNPGVAVQSFLDYSSISGISVYKVLGVRYDGQIESSNEVEVFIPQAVASTQVYAYPSPTPDYIRISANKSGAAILELVSPQGQIYYQEQVELSAQPHLVNVSALADGVFVVRLRFDNGEEVQTRAVKISE